MASPSTNSLWKQIRGLFGAGNRRQPIRWGNAIVPHSLAPYHFLATGATGSGKTSLLRILLQGILPDVLNKELDTRFLIYDAKTEAYQDIAQLGLQSHTVLLNPFDAESSAWDVGKDVTEESHARELAAVLSPPVEGPNKYFYDASRFLVQAAVSSLIRLRGTNWNFRDLILACANVNDLKRLVEVSNVTSVANIEDFLDTSGEAREARSVRMTLTIENNNYATIAAAWHAAAKQNRKFSITDWVEGRNQQVVLLGASKKSRMALAAVNRLVLQRIQQTLMDYVPEDENPERRSWVFLDEFPSLAGIPHLEEFLTEGRSRGICVVLGFQHIAHVRHHYKTLTDALLGQCLHQAYFRANDVTMADWQARQFGVLVTKEIDPTLAHHIQRTSPAATVNDFLELKPATKEAGFQCILRSSEDVLPHGPSRVDIGPRAALVNKKKPQAEQRQAKFIPWKSTPVLEPWGPDERTALSLDEKQVPGKSVPLYSYDDLTSHLESGDEGEE